MTVPSSREKLQALEELAAQDPKDAELAITLGEACLRLGLVDEAARTYARAAELDPRSELKALYWEWLGGVREARGELDAALEAYDNWAQLEPWSVEPLDRQGALLVRLERWTDVILLRPHYLRRVENSNDPRARESLALYYHVLEQLGPPGQVNPLEAAYEALELNSRSLPMRYLLGQIFYASGHLEGARAEYLRVLELDPQRTWREDRFSLRWDAASAFLMLARLARGAGRDEEALERLSASLRLRPDNAEALEETCTLLMARGRYAEALAVLDAAREHQAPTWSDRVRAACLLGLGRVQEARRLLEACIQEPPVPSPSGETLPARVRRSLERAEELLARGEPSAALGRFTRLAQGEAALPARWGRARCLAELERWEEARQELEEVVVRRPADLAAWALLADTYQHLGQPEMHRLALVQEECLAARAQPGLGRGVLAPSPRNSSAAGFRLSALSFPGAGDLQVTGDGGPRALELARLARGVLQAWHRALDLEDPLGRDLHLHVTALGPFEEELEAPALGEEAGLAVLAALGAALAGVRLGEPVALAGCVDLDGTVLQRGRPYEGLVRLREAGYSWSRLVIPQSMAAELVRLPPSLWLCSDLRFARTAAQVVEAVLPWRGETREGSPKGAS
ncbi:MAG TPA: tetratricopeptide repeat protein [Candidatus Nitrosotenuis sp.]|nr:tetratricopeptide repeat protein [Candidatus Nitrosotenuis sp.]